MFDALAPILFLMGDKSEEEKQEALRVAMDKTVIPALTYMESQLKTINSNFIAGEKFTIADCCIIAAIQNLFENEFFITGFESILANYPKMQIYINRLKRGFKGRQDGVINDDQPPKVKIEYFGPFGRADPIRFLLYAAEVDFEDITVSQEEWQELKAFGNAGEFNCLPLVTVDGKELG